jgi:trehalose 6-phosphate synthase/phosphatase
MPVQADRLARVHRVLDQIASATPGSWVEVKSASLAWHYRGADADYGARQALDLRRLLNEVLANQPFDVLAGKKVIEVRLRGVSKAAVARRLQDDSGAGSAIVAIGDDHTDEDLFRALPAASLTVAVGPRPTGAAFRVADYREVRRVLRRLMQPPADTSRPEQAGVARIA